ncbi:shTK domain protein [Ancylostoma duodenale]|uniref:ShTK domain protein n=1 Tax=Ancylostoma duodenale TaxID=51022 RepID=A0A0C2G2L3_9BILA|nr:shTK domain protein [Ancylostoma duodenale]
MDYQICTQVGKFLMKSWIFQGFDPLQTTCTRIRQDRVVQWGTTVGRSICTVIDHTVNRDVHQKSSQVVAAQGSATNLSFNTFPCALLVTKNCVYTSSLGEDACYNGRCQGERCVAQSTQATPPPPIAPTKPVVVVQQTCFNEHECCSYWSGIGECPKNYIYMSEWCKASCRVCQPNYDLNNAQ